MKENGRIQGMVATITGWIAFDRCIPRRLDTMEDVWVPILVFCMGVVGAWAVWKGKTWGYWTALLFSLLQIIALRLGELLGGYSVSQTRSVEFGMIVLSGFGALILILRGSRVPQENAESVG